MNNYSDAYTLAGNAMHILATSRSDIKGRVTVALRELRYLRPDQLPDRYGVQQAYKKLIPYMSGDLYDHFFRERSTKLQEIANTIYELYIQISQDYHSPDKE